VKNTPAETTDGHYARRWLALPIIALAQLMVVLDATIVNIALPSAQKSLHISNADRQWVVTAYTLAFGGLLLLGGRIADYTGRKRTFIIGLLGFAAASALGGAAGSTGLLLGARAAQGVFGALLTPSALSLLTTTFTDPRERGKAFGVYGAVAASGSAVGLVIGGVLTEYLNWRWCLYVNVPIAIIAAVAASFVLVETRAAGRTRYDIPGALTATGGLVALVYGFTKAQTDGWSAHITLGLIAGGVVLLLLFLVIERLVRNPLLPLRVVRHRSRGGADLAVLLGVLGMFAVFFFLNFYLQGVLHYSTVKTGLAFLPLTGGVLAASATATNLITRVRPRFLIGPGLLIAAAGMASLARLRVDGEYASHVLPGLIIVGFGLGMVFVPAVNTATYGVDPHDAGVASATVNTSQQVGGSLGTALLNTIAANATARYLAAHGHDPATGLKATVHGYNIGNAWGAAILAFAGIVGLLLINAPKLATAVPKPNAHEEPVTAAAEPAAITWSASTEPGVSPSSEPAPEFATANPLDAYSSIALPEVGAERPTLMTGLVHSVRGHVRQSSGIPVPGAVVTLIDLHGGQAGRSVTGADGVYDVVAPSSGHYVLVTRAPAHQPQAATIDVNGGALDLDVVLVGSSGLAGVVRAGAGEPVVGATIAVTDAHGDVVANRVTSADGSYDIDDLVVGDYTLVVTAGGFRPSATIVTVPPAGRAVQDVELVGGARLVGVARAGHGRAPLPDARVSLIDDEGQVVAVARTDEGGGYRFSDLRSGRYTVVATGYPPVSDVLDIDEYEHEHDFQLGYPDEEPPVPAPVVAAEHPFERI
jgi:EmrB/QacA subfamily drug resistance transporter